MASLTIKNIPEPLYEQLKQAAQAHHRSINSELIVCLEKVLQPTKPALNTVKSSAQTLRNRVNAKNIRIEDIDTAKQEGRE